MDVERLLANRPEGNGDGSAVAPVDRGQWLGYLSRRREVLIAELRHVEKILVQERVLRSYSLPQKLK